MPSIQKILLVCVSILFMIGNFLVEADGKDNNMKNIKAISPAQWEQLFKQRIYFGHQSVGNNIIDGIRTIMAEYPEIKLNFVETNDFTKIKDGIFAHSKLGKNEDPFSKTDDFVKVIEAGAGHEVDIAFHKYCYIDANASTDVKKVFSHYQERISYLKSKYPGTRFVHITMPLTTVQTGVKAWIKKFVGKPVGGVDGNVKRNDFNRLIIDNYQGKDPVFDLAAIEATKPDGSMVKFSYDGREYLAMHNAYSDDGGHLNKLGQKVIADQFIVFLAEIK